MINLIKAQRLFKSRCSISMKDSWHSLHLPPNARAKIQTVIMTPAIKLSMFQNMVPHPAISFQGGASLAEAQGFESLNPSIERYARPNKNLESKPYSAIKISAYKLIGYLQRRNSS